mmetsp:Transcript_11851/g.38974  ORF Transcript_11851/g.38974 Transcript_11851/m.38974 type:complete len:245 (-) Transcript_11851:2839-3573(-)
MRSRRCRSRRFGEDSDTVRVPLVWPQNRVEQHERTLCDGGEAPHRGKAVRAERAHPRCGEDARVRNPTRARLTQDEKRQRNRREVPNPQKHRDVGRPANRHNRVCVRTQARALHHRVVEHRQRERVERVEPTVEDVTLRRDDAADAWLVDARKRARTLPEHRRRRAQARLLRCATDGRVQARRCRHGRRARRDEQSRVRTNRPHRGREPPASNAGAGERRQRLRTYDEEAGTRRQSIHEVATLK